MWRLGDLPIRRRVAVVLVLTSAVVVLLATAAFATLEYARGRGRLRAEMTTLADVVTANTTAALAFGDREATLETLRSLGRTPGFRRAAAYDAFGRLFATYPARPDRLPRAAPPPAVRFRTDALVVVQAVELEGRRLGTLYFEWGLAGLWAQLLRQVAIALGVLLLATLAAGVVAARLRRTITEPLGKLADVAGRVAAEGARAARVEVEGRDEVSDALLAFNAMLDELAAHETALEEAKLGAEESARLKSAFLANMSHEIRTPLTSIIGFAEMLQEEVEGDPKEYAELISRGGRRLLETLNAVLDLSRLEAGAARLASEPVRVADEVAEAMRLLEPLAAQKGLGLALDVEAPAARARLDRVGLHQIVNNLVRNAIKFTQGGEVRVTLTAGEDRVTVEVRDTGDGIDAAFLPHLFEEFRQESDGLARRHEGVGLGLAITRRLVHMMDGRIDVRSTKGVGSAFTVSFPLLPEEEAPAADGEAAARSGAG